MFAVVGYLSDKSSDVSLSLGQILVPSCFENAGLGAKLVFSELFHNGPSTQKTKQSQVWKI